MATGDAVLLYVFATLLLIGVLTTSTGRQNFVEMHGVKLTQLSDSTVGHFCQVLMNDLIIWWSALAALLIAAARSNDTKFRQLVFTGLIVFYCGSAASFVLHLFPALESVFSLDDKTMFVFMTAVDAVSGLLAIGFAWSLSRRTSLDASSSASRVQKWSLAIICGMQLVYGVYIEAIPGSFIEQSGIPVQVLQQPSSLPKTNEWIAAQFAVLLLRFLSLPVTTASLISLLVAFSKCGNEARRAVLFINGTTYGVIVCFLLLVRLPFMESHGIDASNLKAGAGHAAFNSVLGFGAALMSRRRSSGQSTTRPHAE